MFEDLLRFIFENFGTILSAILGAVIFSVGGYLKSNEEFQVKKFLWTLVLGVLVGVTAQYFGVSYPVALQMLVSAGVVSVVEGWFKGVYRRHIKPVLVEYGVVEKG